MQPLCFIIMPFGKKQDAKGNMIDFDYVYNNFIKVVIEKAGLSPIRADEEMIGGNIQKPMYERLVLCEYAIADLTTANANVFYELGIRYTAKPFTTFSIYEADTKIPFDIADVRCFPYNLENGIIDNLDEKIYQLVNYINGIKQHRITDSPVYQLLDGISFTHNLSHEKVEMLRQQSQHDEQIRAGINTIVRSGKTSTEKTEAIAAIEKNIGDKSNWQAGTAIDFMLAYRSVESFADMVRLIESLPQHLQQTTMIHEQYGFALNRAGNKDKAIDVLQKLINTNGPSSETCGILGRVYKDRYNELKASKPIAAEGFLQKAIDTYLDGYKADMRDFYPGVNAVTLLFAQGKTDTAAELAKVVEFSVNTQLQKKNTQRSTNTQTSFDDYWPHATLLELAVIQNDQDKTVKYLGECLAVKNEPWQRKTTANNLLLLGKEKPWIEEIIAALTDNNQ